MTSRDSGIAMDDQDLEEYDENEVVEEDDDQFGHLDRDEEERDEPEPEDKPGFAFEFNFGQ